MPFNIWYWLKCFLEINYSVLLVETIHITSFFHAFGNNKRIHFHLRDTHRHIWSGQKEVSYCTYSRSAISPANIISSARGGLFAVPYKCIFRASICRRTQAHQCLLPPYRGLSSCFSCAAYKRNVSHFDWWWNKSAVFTLSAIHPFLKCATLHQLAQVCQNTKTWSCPPKLKIQLKTKRHGSN